MKTVVQMMTEAAEQNNCSYKAFSQMVPVTAAGLAPDDGGGGICYGLAVVWLEEKLKANMKSGTLGNKTSATFLANANNHGSQVFARSHLFFKNQLSGDWQEQTGLSPAKDEGGTAKRKVFNAAYDLGEFCDWLCAALGDRYFLIHVRGHTMAAVGSSLGRIQFFDPNGGIVSTRFKSRMVGCLTTYFANDRIKESYRTVGTNRLDLAVEKFR